MSKNRIDQAALSLLKSYDGHLGVNDINDLSLPERETVGKICQLVLSLIFPGYFHADKVSRDRLDLFTKQHLIDLEASLVDQATRAFHCEARSRGLKIAPSLERHARIEVHEILSELADVRGLVTTDVEAAFDNDPAANNREVIVASYPCIEALAVQRFAHRLYRRQVPLIPRMMTEVVHSHTGIDIHPGASIGESFFIDHGTGVVIGETCTIGKNCVLYHGVTLGAWNPLMKDGKGELRRGKSNKRHPDLEDHVTVYPGATILGGGTRIGHHSIIGGNVWLTSSVEPHSVVTIKDPELVIRKRKK